ncbi:sulfatase, partial [bacterium]|nr:sulfatase [bacterium]
MRILYLDLDTLRPDHLGCYGYHRNTSPNIDQIAAEGVRFDQYYCSDAPCLPSRTALMSGRFGIHTGVVNHGGSNADFRIQGADRGFRDQLDATTLPSLLKQQGLYTTFIGGFGERHSSWTFYAGFREIYDTGKGGIESAEDVTPTVLDWLGRNGKNDNWYLHVNYWDPHTPYRVPEEFGNPFADEPLPAWLTEEVVQKNWAHVGPHGAQEVGMYNSDELPHYPRHPGKVENMADLRRMIDGYDCGVRYMDDHIGQLIDALKQAGIWEDTAIIVSADHGENLGELGLYGEHATADAITCRIPMIVRWPGGKKGHVDAGLHYQLDLPPTLAELFQAEFRSVWDGKSYAPVVLNGEKREHDFIVISQVAHVCQRSVRWQDWLYVRTYHDGYHLFPKEMLYNLAEDPHEQHDVAPQHPDICAQCAHKLLDWHDEMMATQPEGYFADPLWQVISEGGPFHAKGHLKD